MICWFQKFGRCLVAMLVLVIGLVCVQSAQAALLVLPQNLTVVHQEAFCGDTSIDQVVLPNGIRQLNSKAFAYSSIRSVNLPSTLSYIADNVFEGTSLDTVTAQKGTYAYNWALRMGYIEPETDPSLFNYTNPSSSGTVSITGFKDTANYPAKLVIPEKSPSGHVITGISSKAFQNCDLLTRVVVPGNVVSIADRAFQGCNLLTAVVLNEGLQTISGSVNYNDYGAFSQCTNLHSIVIPSTVTSIGGHVFYGCTELTSLTLLDGNEHTLSIGEAAFRNTALEGALTIPGRVTSVGNKAFYGTPISSLTIGAGKTKTIGECAFQNCDSLTAVTIPGNVETISSRAFQGCAILRSVTLNEGLKTIGGSVNYNDYGAFSQCVKLPSITIPSTVTSIGGHAFYGCSELTSLTLKDSNSYDLKIANDVFSHTALRGALTIPARVTSIGNGAFYGAPISSLTIKAGKTKTIGECAFQNCDSLTAVTIPANVETISSRAFQGCAILRSVTLNEGLKTIGGSVNYNDYGAFSQCVKLPSITIPGTVTSIAGHAFYGCSELTSLTLRESEYYDLKIANDAFSHTALRGALTIPARVTSIGNGAFYGAPISSLTIKAGKTKTIGECAFQNCDSLTTVVIPANVETISSRAFQGCAILRSVTLNEGLKTIGGSVNYNDYGAFSQCVKLPSITIPTTVTSIGGHAFYGCSELTSLSIPESADYDLSIKNDVFSHTALSGALTLPARVCEIGNGAFYGTFITSLTIREGLHLKTIGECAFQNCDSLTTVTIPGNVETIGGRAFQGCAILRSVTLNEGLKTIGGSVNYSDYGAFSQCVKLPAITFPSTVTSIANHAFYGCSSLSSIVFRGSASDVSIGKSTFGGCPGTPSYQK